VIEATAPLRLAAIASGVSSGCVSAATVLAFISIVMSGGAEASQRQSGLLHRLALLSVITTVLLIVAILYPAIGPSHDAAATSVPLYLVHPGAAIDSVATLAALILFAIATTWIIAVRFRAVSSTAGDDRAYRCTVAAWLLASLALAGDQWARTSVTLPLSPGTTTPRNAGGVALWLLLGALTHPGVRRLLTGTAAAARNAPGLRAATRLMHLGAACMAVAFAAHIVAARHVLTLAPGAEARASDIFRRPWRLVNQGVSHFDVGETDVAALAVDVRAPSGRAGLLTPQLRTYQDVEGRVVETPVSFRAVARGPLQDVLITLDGATEGDVATVRVAFVPLSSLWVPAIVLLAIGGLMTLRRIPQMPSAGA